MTPPLWESISLVSQGLHAAATACSQRHDHLPKILVQMNWAAMSVLDSQTPGDRDTENDYPPDV